MNSKITLIILSIFILSACQSKQPAPPVVTAPPTPVMKMPAPAQRLEKLVKLEGKTDLVCGMPVSAGISDTITYRKKLYGFCSAGCKEEFVKDPIAYINPKK